MMASTSALETSCGIVTALDRWMRCVRAAAAPRITAGAELAAMVFADAKRVLTRLRRHARSAELTARLFSSSEAVDANSHRRVQNRLNTLGKKAHQLRIDP